MSTSERLANLALIAVTASALTVAALLVRRELTASTPSAEPVQLTAVDAERVADGHNRTGNPDAAVTVVEFADFQCPYCRMTARALDSLLRVHSGAVAIVYRHLPLEGAHPFARDAAIAAECAGRQGKFKAYHDVLYERQTEIGRESWLAFARQAQVPDAAVFATCVSNRETAADVDRDVTVADRLGLTATPTVIVNGVRIVAEPTITRIDSLARSFLK